MDLDWRGSDIRRKALVMVKLLEMYSVYVTALPLLLRSEMLRPSVRIPVAVLGLRSDVNAPPQGRSLTSGQWKLSWLRSSSRQ